MLYYYTVMCLLLCLRARTAGAKEILIDNWVLSVTFDEQEATVGDTVRFEWSGYHDVYEFESPSAAMACDFSNALEIGISSPATYIFRENDIGKDLWFGCWVPSHCELGMVIKFTVLDIPETDNPTQSPTTPNSSGIHRRITMDSLVVMSSTAIMAIIASCLLF
jgi:plastocyanin